MAINVGGLLHFQTHSDVNIILVIDPVKTPLIPHSPLIIINIPFTAGAGDFPILSFHLFGGERPAGQRTSEKSHRWLMVKWVSY
jgi:hypothetical protein